MSYTREVAVRVRHSFSLYKQIFKRQSHKLALATMVYYTAYQLIKNYKYIVV